MFIFRSLLFGLIHPVSHSYIRGYYFRRRKAERLLLASHENNMRNKYCFVRRLCHSIAQSPPILDQRARDCVCVCVALWLVSSCAFVVGDGTHQHIEPNSFEMEMNGKAKTHFCSTTNWIARLHVSHRRLYSK